jgi:hypothetical protein
MENVRVADSLARLRTFGIRVSGEQAPPDAVVALLSRTTGLEHDEARAWEHESQIRVPLSLLRVSSGIVEICAPWIAVGAAVKTSVEATVTDWVKRRFGPRRNSSTSRVVTFCGPDGKVENEVDENRDLA